ncbi:MAG: M56 family metallopeptidase [Lachnospiraceae bacterium]|nr:M56 family metallopeptidase [Lachnospiraceae bacterium]
MKLLFLLSLSGSIALVFSIFFQKAIKQFLSCGWQSLWLKMTLALYLISGFAVMGIKYLVKKSHLMERSDEEINIFISHKSAGVLRYADGVSVNRAFIVYAVITFAMAAVMLFFFLKKLLEYRKIKRAVTSEILYKKANIPEEEIEKLKSMIRLKKDVQVYLTDMQTGAFTIGYFHPVIVLRDEQVKEKQEVILLHELCHIKRKDSLFKFIAMAAVCVHWFNPLIYCLPGLLNRNSELNCDEMVVRYLSTEQRKIYAQEIISQSKSARKEGDLFMRLGGNVSLTKERVINIMKERNTKDNRGLKYLAAVLTFVMLVISSVPVWAYDGVPVFDISGEEEVIRHQYEDFSNSDIVFMANGSYFYEYDIDIRYDQQFIDENGNIFEVDLDKDGRVGCIHFSVSTGEYKKHIKNSTGGCVVETYSAKRCDDCGVMIVGNLISSNSFPVCIH